MPAGPALPPGRFENTGAGLEPKRQCGKPFRRDPTATEARFQVNLHILWPPTPKGVAAYILVEVLEIGGYDNGPSTPGGAGSFH